MFFWVLRCVRHLISAVVALAGLLALAEVGLRVSRLTDSASASLDEPPAAPAWMAPSDVTGWGLPRSARFQETDAKAGFEWTTNSWGHRSAEPAVPKPPGVYRIICLGDEALLGATLTDDQLFTHQLQVLLQQRTQYPIEVINGAIPQGCPLTLALQLRLQLGALQPDLVLLQMSDTDVQQDHSLRRWTIRDGRGQPLLCVHPDFQQRSRGNRITECRREFALVDWCLTQISQADGVVAPTGPTAPSGLRDEDIRTALEPLGLMSRHCQASYARLVAWSCPTEDTGGLPQRHQEFFRVAASVLAELQVPAVDALAAMQPQMLDGRVGWTAVGHRRLAEHLADQLLRNLPGPWSSPYLQQPVQPATYATPEPDGHRGFYRTRQ